MVVGFPKYFSPNNDSVNDTWHLIGIEEIDTISVSIFNRYGKLLKTLDNVNGWNGTYKNANMPSDDYWFVANLIRDGKTHRIKGHFALIR